MRRVTILLFLAAMVAVASAPDLGPYTWVYANNSRIDVGYYGAPCIVDWNGDGDKDMLLGQFTSGNIRFYANQDENDSPVFTSYVMLQADGSPITLPAG